MRTERVITGLGGLAFAGSLAFCAWTYLAAWRGEAGSDSPSRAIVADAALFGLFAAHHSLAARPAIKRRLAWFIPEPFLRSAYVWTASALLTAVCALWRPIRGSLYDDAGWRTAVHVAVQVAGVWLIARSVSAIDARELAGITRSTTRSDLQVSGPYRWIRHPLYLGWILVVFGTPHMTANRLAFAAISTGYLVLAIPWEERSLKADFGDEYRRYAARVPWRLIPFVY